MKDLSNVPHTKEYQNDSILILKIIPVQSHVYACICMPYSLQKLFSSINIFLLKVS